ncbi:translesion error-prone DNA polymerase V autoproteolytic subunit [Paraflavisolibacter sp. H34]|uniref:LexA family protein n=1 Tax=Huijunlia imazamoxiresistens TaxID=3127457 RepID=UPI003016309D
MAMDSFSPAGGRAPDEPAWWQQKPAGGYEAMDAEGRSIDLNEQLVRNKPATFFLRVNGNAMIGAGIHHGDVVIVDRSLEAANGKVVIALLNGEMLIRRLQVLPDKRVRLVPDTKSLASIEVDPFSNFFVWGVVTYVIHTV